MIGIYDCFGYGGSYDVAFEERYRLIKKAGFSCVMLWWSDKFGRGAEYEKDVQFAVDAGLKIENIHAPVHEQNFLSFNTDNGESVFKSYLQCVKDCFKYGVRTAVVHLPSDDFPINDLGKIRLDKIIEDAVQLNIQIAFENLNNTKNLDFVLNAFCSDNVGFCYDSCHHLRYANDIDLLSKYGSRLMALHLHDNGGKNNQHQLPFDGDIEWENLMKKISNTGYKGSTTIEPMNWDYENLTIQEFLKVAYGKAKKLDDMRG